MTTEHDGHAATAQHAATDGRAATAQHAATDGHTATHHDHSANHHDHAAMELPPGTSLAQFWDGRYGESDRIWSGNPNEALVREVSELAPGTALDLGCGEGGDAIWLARRGWRVTATDVSRIALDRAAGHAAEAGVADRVDWQVHDLAESFPAGRFDLVSAAFLHSPGMDRDQVLRAAAGAVAPGGVLLVLGHASAPPRVAAEHPDVRFPSPDDVLAALDLPRGAWEVQAKGEYERVRNDLDGKPGAFTDNLLRVRRLPSR